MYDHMKYWAEVWEYSAEVWEYSAGGIGIYIKV